MGPSRWVTNTFAVVILGVWAASFVVGALADDYSALTITTPVLFLAGGFAFSVKYITHRSGNGDGPADR